MPISMKYNHLPVNRLTRSQRRLAQKTAAQKLHTISLMVREEGGIQIFQWGGNTGDWFSPVFDDLEVAHRYPSDVGLSLQK